MSMGAIWDNPIILFLIITLISWFFQRDKGTEKPDETQNRKYTSPPKNKSEPVKGQSQPIGGKQDDDIRKKIQEREREIKKKLSGHPDLQREATSLAQTIKEQYEAQKKKVQQAEKPVVIKETPVDVIVPREFKPIVQKAVKQATERHVKPSKQGFDVRNINLQEAFVMSEILGPPRSKRKQIR
ncbi:hypothetical protein F7984_13840 [Pradoshia sp. D12]|uniref:hypothetical protein n=1 Tax=Bacillaceae TaxID=186817 RepID=UPI00080ACD0C|nr:MULTISPECIES: hypothetical protein [Bacillaceae]OCA86444.1 hypothetical protein A8L44_08550 [Bacillus sp. FJAT-27986]QFK72243.1 hypothetical protein F7984_13840 [Pradoshia sp. D12]TPF71264.1 hypothetical protein FHY44_12355 [Bacillus sp. D12]